MVYIHLGETRNCVLEGFTITGGRGGGPPPDEHRGGGVLIREAEPVVRGNVITGNTALQFGYGGGVYCQSSFQHAPFHPLIAENVISGNVADGNGAGIGAREGMAPEIRDNTISENTVQYGDAGGMWLFLYGDGAIISGNRISKNYAGDHGGGIYAGSMRAMYSVFISITDNVIDENAANGRAMNGDSGGGVWLFQTSWKCVGTRLLETAPMARQAPTAAES